MTDPAPSAYLATIGRKGGNKNSPAQQLARAKPKPGGGRPPMNPSAEELRFVVDHLRTCNNRDGSGAMDAVAAYLERKGAKRAAGRAI